MDLAESFQFPIVFGPSTAATGADVSSLVGSSLGSDIESSDIESSVESSDGSADAEAAGAGAASSLPLSGRVTTTTARRMIPTMIAARTLPEAPCLGADAAAAGLLGAEVLFVAGLGVDETSTRPAPRDDDEGTGGITTDEAEVARFLAALFLTVFFAADFLTADFLTVFFAALFFTADFLTVFLAALFFTADFLTVFLATDFFAVDFLATDFFAALFFTAAFLAAGFFLTATITPCFGCAKFSLARPPFFLHAGRLLEELFRDG